MSKQTRNAGQQGRHAAQHDALAALMRASEGTEALARALAEDDDSRVIEQELVDLLQARRYFCDWIAELRREGDSRSTSPAQYLRAWNDSTARVIQLLRARKQLQPTDAGLDTLFDQVLKELDEEAGRVRH